MKFKNLFFLNLSLLLGLSRLSALSLVEPSWDGTRPDAHAPIGVMGDHTHNQGEWMLSYRYMFMRMDESFDGDSSISERSRQGMGSGRFPVIPTDMDMSMHMFGMMYAPSDELTLVGMLHHTELSMDHLFPGGVFNTETSGWGDLQLGALYRFHDAGSSRAHAGLNLILPTGAFDERDVTPASSPAATVLPYPMQPATGAWGLRPSITYLEQFDRWSWGAQGSLLLFLNENDDGWHPGPSGQLTAWAARRLGGDFSASLRLTGTSWGDVEGRNPSLNPMMVPTARTDLRGGSRVDIGVGLNYQLTGTGLRIGTELVMPVYQYLDGPQLGTDYSWTVGVQFAW